MLPLANGLFIAWKNDCFRSRATARTFGCPIEFLGQDVPRGPWRYIALMAQTWRTLSRVRPATVLCLNQPPMLPMVCGLWTRLHGGQVVQDFHSGALSKRQWRPFLPIYRWMVRHSPFTLVHNRVDALALSRWRAPLAVLLTLPAAPRAGLVRARRPGRPLFMFVCTFAADEPVQEALAAFRACPQADFHITGNFGKAGLKRENMPPNVTLLGFVDYADYEQLMAECTAVITLSDRPHIMQMAVEEALTLGVPVLTNQSPTLQEALGDAGVFVELKPDSIAEGVRQVIEDEARLQHAASHARERCWRDVQQVLADIRVNQPSLFA